jgi:integrase
MDLAQAMDLFLLFKRGEGLSLRTVEFYGEKLRDFLGSVGDGAVSALTPAAIVRYLVALQDRGQAPLTVEGSYRTLLCFFNWAEASPDVGHPPSPIGHGQQKLVKRPKVDAPEMDFATYEEYVSLTTAIDLASWIDYRDWCMIGIMFWCGVRRGELLAMQISDIDFAKDRILVRKSKARRQRSVFLVHDLMAGLRQYLALRPFWAGDDLWVAYDKARRHIAGTLTATGLRLMLKRRCKRARIRFLHPHLFRHGFAMAYLNHGVDLKAVGDLMGHSSYKTTETHYARWMDEPLRKLHKQTAEAILLSGC